MRPHGLVAGDHEVDIEANDDVPGRRVYALWDNPNRACQACDNCGMEFSKGNDGKCSSGGGNEDGDDDGIRCCRRRDVTMVRSIRTADGWAPVDGSKLGKGRVHQHRLQSWSRSEEEVLANWLLMLSSSSTSATAADQSLTVAEEDGEEEERVESKDSDEKKTTTHSNAAFQCKG